MKLARIMEGTRAKSVQELEQTSVAAALADMFPSDLAPLTDMSGKMYAHTVSSLWRLFVCKTTACGDLTVLQ